MIKIAFLVPGEGQIELVKGVYLEHSRVCDANAENANQYHFEVYVAAALKDVPPPALEADVIIARGLITSQLKKAYPNVAVVEVPIGSEMVAAIYAAFAVHGRQPVAVIGSYNMVHSAHGIGEVLGADIKSYLQTDNGPAAVKQHVDEVLAAGRRVIVTGTVTHAYASTRDCFPVVVRMGKESIWQAITEAKHGAVLRRRERERAEQFRTVLNYAYEGVIATDIEGRITVFNAAAADTLQLAAAAALGRRIDEIVPRGQLNSLFRGSVDATDKIIPHRGELLSVNKVSVLLHGDFSGHVVTLQKSSAIQKTESRIRLQLYAKGHVARYTFEDIVGNSPKLMEAVDDARNFASVTSNILIIGDTGTGKEMFAQSIHNASSRRGAPFVALNCAALAKSLLESELFGYAEGAFTGAAKGGKPGIFEIAHTGTILLDEISEIPLDLQGRLLRVLQERQIMRLGDDKIIPIDVRIVSATNKNLLAEVHDNKFRRDLYYRLNVLTLHLPTLNERDTDLLRLAAVFIEEYCARFQKPPIALTDDACAQLMRHRWDGNIRELRNVCECLVVLNKTGTLGGDDFRKVFDKSECKPITAKEVSYAEELRSFDRDRIMKALAANRGDKGEAAKQLGMSKTTLWRRMKSLNIETAP